mmetsp:Transcript_7135/g.11760  ORF Transcript_7135/g.11760 Transcript_7135/m.11760 type:complete len:373 (+) Transcript_7135:73-1191(+)
MVAWYLTKAPLGLFEAAEERRDFRWHVVWAELVVLGVCLGCFCGALVYFLHTQECALESFDDPESDCKARPIVFSRPITNAYSDPDFFEQHFNLHFRANGELLIKHGYESACQIYVNSLNNVDIKKRINFTAAIAPCSGRLCVDSKITFTSDEDNTAIGISEEQTCYGNEGKLKLIPESELQVIEQNCAFYQQHFDESDPWVRLAQNNASALKFFSLGRFNASGREEIYHPVQNSTTLLEFYRPVLMESLCVDQPTIDGHEKSNRNYFTSNKPGSPFSCNKCRKHGLAEAVSFSLEYLHLSYLFMCYMMVRIHDKIYGRTRICQDPEIDDRQRDAKIPDDIKLRPLGKFASSAQVQPAKEGISELGEEMEIV